MTTEEETVYCTCSPAEPAKCKLHPEMYYFHLRARDMETLVAKHKGTELQTAWDRLSLSAQTVERRRTQEVEDLQRLVLKSTPTKNYGLRRFFMERKRKPGGLGGASDYEVWLRTLEFRELSRLVQLYTSALDGLRFRRRFVQHEVERRFLHSSYGKHAAEDLFDLAEVRP